MFRNTIYCITLAVACLSGACTPRIESASRILERQEHEYVVTLLLDMSGSFENLMCEQGVAYAFAMQVVQRYFHDRIGSQDRLVIAQISGIDQALLWEGSPHELRRQFPTAKDFAAYLRSKSHPAGSAVHKAIHDSVEYVLDKDTGRSAVFVLSDMLDTGPQEGRQQALEMLEKFARKNGVVALYYVAPELVAEWKADLAKAGFDEFRVESAIVQRPTLPSFE